MKHLMAFLVALMMALCGVSAWAAADAPGSYMLLGSETIPAPLDQRVLSGQQIQDLIFASQEELKAQLSTFADYVAWIEAVNSGYWLTATSNEFNQITIGGDHSFNWVHHGLGSNTIADLCFQFLQDDYPGMKTVMSVAYIDRDSYICFSNAFPVDGGYIILGADSFAANARANNSGPATHSPMFVEDLSAVIDYCRSGDALWGLGGNLSQVMVIHSDEQIVFNVEDLLFVADNPAPVETLFIDTAALPGVPTLESYYGFSLPGQPAPAINDRETAEAIRNGTVEDAAAKINTIQDVMNYVYFSNYRCGDGDMTIPVRNNLVWHFNYKPDVVFARHTGCCGATAGLVAYLLEGDYEEVGIVGITYTEGCGGGHVINYIKHSGMYYVFDVFGWGYSNYSGWGMRMCWRDTLTAACLDWAQQTGEVQCMYTYTNPALGDAPVGWKTDRFRVSYLIKDYAENIQIHLENPEEGYVYEFVEVDPQVLQAIELVRCIW